MTGYGSGYGIRRVHIVKIVKKAFSGYGFQDMVQDTVSGVVIRMPDVGFEPGPLQPLLQPLLQPML